MIPSHHIFQDEKALVLETSDSALVLKNIPTAFQLTPTIVGMPQDVENTARLAVMGVQVPSPITYQYRWPRDKALIPQPFKHQIETAAFAVTNPHGYILNDIGTGKSLTALWAADYLMSLGYIHRVLIAAPLSTLERVWGDA